MPNFGNPTAHVIFNPLPNQPVKNGYAVTWVTKTGKYQDEAPVCSGVDVPSGGAWDALWNNRLIASGSTSVVTR